MTSERISRVWGTILLTITIFSLSLPAYAQYSGGTGDPDNPYQIATAEDLMLLGESPEDYDKHFILIADIDLDPNLPGGKVFYRGVIGYHLGWGIGAQVYPFTGVFDGNGHTISNLTMAGQDFLGLFGSVGSSAEVKNLGVVNVNIDASDSHFGDVGGLVGSNAGKITASYSTGIVSVDRGYIGGLVGHNSGSITASYSTATVNGGRDYIGGLVGDNDEGYITMSYSTGAVTGGYAVGGLVGRNIGETTNCYSTSTVSGNNSVGGLVGTNHDSDMWGVYPGIVAYCYSTGEVSGSEYSTGEVNGTGVGGLVGSNKYFLEKGGVVRHSFWDTQTSCQTTSYAGTGLTTAGMQMIKTFQAWGTCGNEGVWTIDEGKDYPRLAWENQPGEDISSPPLSHFLTGTGTESDPFLIYTPEELNMVGLFPCEFDKHFKLVADIDMSGFDGIDGRPAFNIIGGDCSERSSWQVKEGTSGLVLVGIPFGGVFDGNGHTISNLTVVGNSHLGLFGALGSPAEVKNLGIVDVKISGLRDYVGALAGYNTGSVIGCYSNGLVNGTGGVGGLVGVNDSYSSISLSYSSASVSGTGSVGGLVGENWGSISSSYSSGSVTGVYRVGGLVGGNSYGSISLSDSFWDTQTSGQATSDGGTGKTTAEMQTASTFIDAGWDFVDETVNGPNDVWKMWDGYDYPRLAWEPGPNTALVFVDINDPGFYGQMSKYEVTNAQYCDFLNAALASGDITVNDTDIEGASGSNSGEDYAGQRYYRCDGSGYTGYGATNGGAARIHYNEGAFSVEEGFGNHPVTYVSWYGAMAFCNYYGYYLPAEEQWQAVADYDGTYIYGCGLTIDPGIANYRNTEHPDGTTPVGSFDIYGYGMSDMAGNVWEWTSSALDSSRIFRGGSLGSIDLNCDVSIRGDGIPYANYWDIGFRVCR